MERQTCYRCDLLAEAVVSAVERHANLLGKLQRAGQRGEAGAIAELDTLLIQVAQEREEAFREYLAHRQAEAYAKSRVVKISLLPVPTTG